MKQLNMRWILIIFMSIIMTGCGSDEPMPSARQLEFTILPFKGVKLSGDKVYSMFYGVNIDRGMVAALHINGFDSYHVGNWYKTTVESKNGTLAFLSAETILQPKGIDYESLILTVTPIDDYKCDAVDEAGTTYEKINIEGLEMLTKGTYEVRVNKVTVLPSGNNAKIYFLLTGVISRP